MNKVEVKEIGRILLIRVKHLNFKCERRKEHNLI